MKPMLHPFKDKVIVYSLEKLDRFKGQKGVVYASPLFAQKPITGAKLVYTDDAHIKMLYDNVGVEVQLVNEKKKKKKKKAE